MPTDVLLLHWRGGHTKAERLCAGILVIEGYGGIDPQSPLGGRDAGKDIECTAGGQRYVAAVSFPPTLQSFAAIEAKFGDDLEKALVHEPFGFLFFINQKVTPGERTKLVSQALERGVSTTEVYHVERIRAILDSAAGYALRHEYLGVRMTAEEQLSAFKQQLSEFASLRDEMARQRQKSQLRMESLRTLSRVATVDTPSSVGWKVATPTDVGATLTNGLTIEAIALVHRAVLGASPSEIQPGRLRGATVWVGHPGSGPESATFRPPPPKDVPTLLGALLQDWNNTLRRSTELNDDAKLEALASFHHQFTAIHPFLDGNGRVARILGQHQCARLFEVESAFVFDNRPAYYAAIQAADKGDLSKLKGFIREQMESTSSSR